MSTANRQQSKSGDPARGRPRIRHLNCGTLAPLGGRNVNGTKFPLLPARMVCHCLLLETNRGLVLVDSGFGLGDLERLRLRRFLFKPWTAGPQALARKGYTMFATRARLQESETAIRQVEGLGFSADDVTDIVLTHLDLDHAGGLPEFPSARVHVSAVELEAAMDASRAPVRSVHRFRYWSHQWAHDPEWVTYEPPESKHWLGAEGVGGLDGLPGISLISLPGHTRGHCGVAIDRHELGGATEPGERWLLHAGDTYFDHREINPERPRSTPGLASFQNFFQDDVSHRRGSRAAVRALVQDRVGVEVFCSHDPVEFERYQETPV